MKYQTCTRFSGSRALLACVALVCLICWTSACSSSKSKKRPRNTISQYDPEFDPDPDDRAFPPNAPDPSALNPERSELDDALAMYDSELYSSARTLFKDMQSKYPSSYYAALFELKIADCSYAVGEYEAAIESYQEFARLRPKHEAVPYVRLQVANAHFAQYRGVVHDQSPLTEALAKYEALVKEFPGSAYAEMARTLIARCQERLAAHEAYVANFYFKHGQKEAGVQRVLALMDGHGVDTTKQLVNAELVELALEDLGPEESKNILLAELSESSQPETLDTEKEVLASSGTDAGFARFRLATTAADAEKAVEETAAEESAVAPVEDFIAASRLTEVQCDKADDKTIFTTVFNKRPLVEVSKKDQRFEMLLSFPDSSLQPLDMALLEKLKNCVQREVSLQVEQSAEASQLLISFRIEAGTEARHMVLDRPHRLIGLIIQP